MLEITKGEYKGERTGIIAVHPVGVKNSIGRNVATCNSLFIPESEMLANQSVIVDSLNTYQQCGKLPSELLRERNELISVIEQMFKDADVFFQESGRCSKRGHIDWGTFEKANNLLTKLKAE